MKTNYHCFEIDFASPFCDQFINLRNVALRVPLGLQFNANEIEEEWSEIHIVALDANHSVVGGLMLKEISPTITKMRQVVVIKSLRGKGIGILLVAYAEKLALMKGFSHIVLNARKNVVNFYLKLDYKIEGDEFTEVGIPHSKMIKKL